MGDTDPTRRPDDRVLRSQQRHVMLCGVTNRTVTANSELAAPRSDVWSRVTTADGINRFTVRIPGTSGIATVVVWTLFRHRHRRLRRHFGESQAS